MTTNYPPIDYTEFPYNVPRHIREEAKMLCGEAELSASSLRYENHSLDYYKYDKEDFDQMRERVAEWAKSSEYPTNILVGVSNLLIDDVENRVKEKFSN